MSITFEKIVNIFQIWGESTTGEIVFKTLPRPPRSSLQLCLPEGGDFFVYDWNPIMQTILVKRSHSCC